WFRLGSIGNTAVRIEEERMKRDGGESATRLRMAIQKDGRRIATKYPRTAGRFLAANDVEAEIIALSGALELAPVLDLASAIIDISASGSSLVAHDLVPLYEI